MECAGIVEQEVIHPPYEKGGELPQGRHATSSSQKNLSEGRAGCS